MRYAIHFNTEESRLEIVVLNRKGNLETTIHGDDVLSVMADGIVYKASDLFALKDAIPFPAVNLEKQDENSSRNESGVGTEQSEEKNFLERDILTD